MSYYGYEYDVCEDVVEGVEFDVMTESSYFHEVEEDADPLPRMRGKQLTEAEEQLFGAVEADNVEKAKSLLSSGVEIRSTSKKTLKVRSSEGQIVVVKLLPPLPEFY